MTPMFVDPDPEPTTRKQLHASWNGVPIYVRSIAPPVPARHYDWCAHLSAIGDGGEAHCYAYGETREIAIANLVEHLMERGA